MSGKKRVVLTLAAAAALLLCGCSKSVRNYQIAESIGTLGKYENNEPVETPKMKAERELKESEAALEKEQEDLLAQAEDLAKAYHYEDAITLLQTSDELRDDERAAEAVETYQRGLDQMYVYDGAIGHLCFTNLVVDTDRAFDGDEYAPVYRQNMITLEEFENILNTLYDSGYILIDIHSLAEKVETADGDITLIERDAKIPEGRKPLILSVENLNYESVRNGDGVATRLALDGDGNVGAVYTDEGGHDLIGPYDVVPVVEQFIEEHPDFSFQGARGIIALSGAKGVFGYAVEEESSADYKENQQTVKEIADKLREDGWTFATEGYGYLEMGNLTYEDLREDVIKWRDTIGPLVGECDTLLYPSGSEVDYSTEKAALLFNQGYCYLVGMWSDNDYLEVNQKYLRQTRRTITGYVLENYPNNFSTYFSTSAILDDARK